MTGSVRALLALAGIVIAAVLAAILAGAWGAATLHASHSPSLAAVQSDAAVVPSGTPAASPSTSTAIPTPVASIASWKTVVDDKFDGDLPSHWTLYQGPYKSGAQNCATPSHTTIHDGALDMLFAYEAKGICGPGWYSSGLAITGFSSIDSRVTVRFRVVETGGVAAHRIIPMRWPDDATKWPAAGEEDYCEGILLSGCSTVIHFDPTNQQESHQSDLDLTAWHTIAVERRQHVVTVQIDDGLVWTYAGSETTLPGTLKHVVLQQECQKTCPSGTTGTEDILIDFVKVEVPV